MTNATNSRLRQAPMAHEVRIPSAGKRVAALDGMRGVAVALVMLGHAGAANSLPGTVGNALAPLFSGELGVLIFFVLSGYLITGILLGEEHATRGISLRAFYAR